MAIDAHDPDVLVAAYSSGVARSTDGGAHWIKVLSADPGTTARARGAGDPVLVADSQGNFFYSRLGSDAYAIQESTDQGQTWTTVGAPLHNPLPAGPSVPDMSVHPSDGPVYMGPSAIGCDRPLMAVDMTTDALYATCADHGDQSGGEGSRAWVVAFIACRTNVFSSGVTPNCGRRYVSASYDHGRTWTSWQPEDDAGWPAGYTGAFDGAPAAAHGVLATAYVAGAAPGSSCTQCVVFETTTDAGVTWSRELVPGATPQIATLSAYTPAGEGAAQNAIANDSQSVWFEPYVAADPKRLGHYAIMLLDATRTEMLIYETRDAGRTWSDAVTVGDRVHHIDKPAMAFGPTGALGLMWKSVEETDLSFDVWAAVSPGPQLRFPAPVRLSSRPSQEETCGLGGQEGQAYGCDELSWTVMDTTHLDAVWGDNRADETPYFGRYDFADDAPERDH